MPDLDLAPYAPTEMPGLTSGTAYGVIATVSNGKILTEAETKTGTWKIISQGDSFYLPILPGTKLRFTLYGDTAGNVRVTPAV